MAAHGVAGWVVQTALDPFPGSRATEPPPQILAHPYTAQLRRLPPASFLRPAGSARWLPVAPNPDLEVAAPAALAPPLVPPAPPVLVPYDVPAEGSEGSVRLEKPAMVRFGDVEKGGLEVWGGAASSCLICDSMAVLCAVWETHR